MTHRELIKEILFADLGSGPYKRKGGKWHKFEVLAKSPGILCGMELIPTILSVIETEFFDVLFDDKRSWKILHTFLDGDEVNIGSRIAYLEGDAEILLKSERTICNLISRLSGIATVTREKIRKIEGTKAKLLDTRKDLSIIRLLNKKAVAVGGAGNHRAGFPDGIMIKDNDIAVYGGVSAAISTRLIPSKPLLKREVEVNSMARLQEALNDGRADIIMLDNFRPSDLKKAVEIIRNDPRPKPYDIEASGIGDHDLREIAETGVDYISTSSLVREGEGKPMDVSMKVC